MDLSDFVLDGTVSARLTASAKFGYIEFNSSASVENWPTSTTRELT